MANISLGDALISFTLPGADDKTHSTSDFADAEALAVIFSCNHCPYVRAWEDRMIQIQTDYADRGVRLVAINSNDPAKYESDSFPAERTPEVFLFDKSGVLKYHGAIDDNYDDPSAVEVQYLRDALDAILAGEEPPLAQTPPVGCTVKWK
jgi:peroxiredoxin